MKRPASALLIALVLALGACDRNLEAFDPDEEVRAPDLSKIFPEGAERAEAPIPELVAPPGERGAPPLPPEVVEGGPGPGSDAPPIEGRVELAAEVAGALPDGAILFIIARRGGGGPPLAVKRIPDPSFPLDFAVGPSDRMIQQMPFAGPITLSARLDGDGNASSKTPGDLLGTAQGGPVDPGATGVRIVLDTRL